MLGGDFFYHHKCVLDYKRKVLHVRNPKLVQSHNYSLNIAYLPVIHSGTPLSAIGPMIGEDYSRKAIVLEKPLQIVVANGYVVSWEGKAIEYSNVVEHKIDTETSPHIWIPA